VGCFETECYGRRKGAAGTHVSVGTLKQKVCRFQHHSPFGQAADKPVVRITRVTFLWLGRHTQPSISIIFDFQISNLAPRSVRELRPSTVCSLRSLTTLISKSNYLQFKVSIYICGYTVCTRL
jgi:hypothetical protein